MPNPSILQKLGKYNCINIIQKIKSFSLTVYILNTKFHMHHTDRALGVHLPRGKK